MTTCGTCIDANIQISIDFVVTNITDDVPQVAPFGS